MEDSYYRIIVDGSCMIDSFGIAKNLFDCHIREALVLRPMWQLFWKTSYSKMGNEAITPEHIPI